MSASQKSLTFLEEALVIEVTSVLFARPDGHYCVVRGNRDGFEESSVIAVGQLGTVNVGERMRLTGKWTEHPKYGRQFAADTAVQLRPTHGEGLVRFLGSGLVPGVGPSLASRIVERFGEDTLDIITGQHARLSEVEGVGKKRAAAIAQAVKNKRAEAETLPFLFALGIGHANARRILDKYGSSSPQVINDNPYILAEEIRGIGFVTADRIGREAGIGPEDPRRAAGALLHLVAKSVDDGHVFLPKETLLSHAEALDVPRLPAEEALSSLADDGLLISERDCIYAPPLFLEEQRVARKVASLATAPAKKLPQTLREEDIEEAFPTLTNEQRRAVASAIQAHLVIITGGPGTGKTTTVRAIVEAHHRLGKRVLLCAPTGRAAKRLSEASGHPAATIHRLLEWNPATRRFSRDARRPLETELLLVDEASMLDLRLAYRLLEAVPATTHLVLVGDTDQLPPIGPGQVLRSIIDSESATVVRLREVFRQAQRSAIVRGAHTVLAGEPPDTSEAFAQGDGELFVVHIDDPEEAQKKLVSVVTRLSKAYDLDPAKDLQVLTPMRKGPLGTDKLNQALKAVLNPAKENAGAQAPAKDHVESEATEKKRSRAQGDNLTRPLSPGDKVMQLRNDYDREVFNGDQGSVTRVDGGSLYVEIDGREVQYSSGKQDALTLAYACTVHKVQGSEFPAVVMVLHRSHHVLLSRALLYTGITRAKRVVVLLADKGGMQRGTQNVANYFSHSQLSERIQETIRNDGGALFEQS